MKVTRRFPECIGMLSSSTGRCTTDDSSLCSLQGVGMLYLHEVLKPIINRIFDDKKYIELDPCKIDLNRTR